RWRGFNEQALQSLGRKAVADDLDPGLAADFRQLLELPLIHDEIVLAQNPLDERFEAGVFLKELLECRAADAFGEAGAHDDRAALLDDGQSAGETFDRLIKGRVERIPGAARHDDIDWLDDRIANDAADKANAFFECRDH